MIRGSGRDIRSRIRTALLFTMAGLGVLVLLSVAGGPGCKKRGSGMKITRLVVGPLQVNCYIVADERTGESIVIDPGDDGEKVLAIIREKGLVVKYVINTHAHFDHVGANRAVKEATGAELLIHEADDALLASTAGQARMFGMNAPASPRADRYVKHGDVIAFGDIRLTVLHTPGHSAGGICLAGNGVVFTGDALFAGSIGRTDLMGGDLMTLIGSIRQHLLPLPDETLVLSGHGPDSTIGDERRENPFLSAQSGF